MWHGVSVQSIPLSQKISPVFVHEQGFTQQSLKLAGFNLVGDQLKAVSVSQNTLSKRGCLVQQSIEVISPMQHKNQL